MNICIIPARGGSKGILKKNLQEVGGVPLIVRAIAASKGADWVHEVCVSTDDRIIAQIAKDHGADVVHRPHELSHDNSTSEEAVLHALKKYPEAHFAALVQCTSPFVTGAEIDACMAKLEREDLDCVFTAAETHSGYWIEDIHGPRCLTQDQIATRMPRQMSIPTWRETGAVYALRVGEFKNRWPLTRFCGKTGMLPVSDKSAFEIDLPYDLSVCRAIAEIRDCD